MPWVIDREYRGEWPDEPRTEHALIAHIDPDRLKAGEVVWSLVYVDLTVAAEGVKAVQAAEAYLAAPKFKHADVAAAPAGDAGTPPAPTTTGTGGDQPKENPCDTDSNVAYPTTTAGLFRTSPGPRLPPSSTSSGTTSSTGSSTTSSMDTRTTRKMTATSSESTSSTSSATTRPSASPTAQMVAAQADRREALRERRRRMRTNAASLGWLAEFDAQWTAAGIGKDSTDDEVEAALNAIEPPFDTESEPVVSRHQKGTTCDTETLPDGTDPTSCSDGTARSRTVTDTPSFTSCGTTNLSTSSTPSSTSTSGSSGTTRVSTSSSSGSSPDNGGPVDQADIDALLAAVRSSDVRAVVNGWLRQGNLAGASWDPRYHPDVRRYEITRAALALAVATDGDDDVARVMIGWAWDYPAGAGGQVVIGAEARVGFALGDLTITEAKRLTALAEALGPQLGLRYDADGQPHLDGDVAAVLRNVA